MSSTYSTVVALVHLAVAVSLSSQALRPSDVLAGPAQAQTTPMEPGGPPARLVDILVALDNSGSMKTNDPNGLMREVVAAFAERLAPGSRLGIVIFDQRVELVLPLTEVEESEFKSRVAASTKRVDYRGRLTDIPAGVERALYELRQQGRPEAERLIVFLTDGLVDLGDPVKDADRAHWLRGALAQEAKRLGVRISGIAFTEAADFELIQSVAQTTGGEYFRVLSASDIGGVFESISARIHEIARQSSAAAEPAPPASVPARNWRPWAVAVMVGFTTLGVVAMLVVLRLRRAKRGVIVPGARLLDPSQHAGASEHAITKVITRIGRDPNSNDIVIAQDTVSSQHAVIECRGERFYLRDLRSANGTFLNSRKFSDAEAIREAPLKTRDRVRFDVYEFEFVLDALKDVQETRLAGAAAASRTRFRVEQGEPPAAAPIAQPVQVVAAPPAPAEAAALDERSEARTRLKHEMCPRHPSWKATELCAACGRGYCEWCMSEKDHKAICVECREKGD